MGEGGGAVAGRAGGSCRGRVWVMGDTTGFWMGLGSAGRWRHCLQTRAGKQNRAGRQDAGSGETWVSFGVRETQQC